jgi:hypothetical protein
LSREFPLEISPNGEWILGEENAWPLSWYRERLELERQKTSTRTDGGLAPPRPPARLYVWDTASGKEVDQSPSGGLFSTFSPDGRLILV